MTGKRVDKNSRKNWKLYIVVLVIFVVVAMAMEMRSQPVVEEQVAIIPTVTMVEPVIITEEPVVAAAEPEVIPQIDFNQVYAEMLAKTAWGEARGCDKTGQAAVMWCILNRVDSGSKDFRESIPMVITQPDQFHYSYDFPLEEDLLDLAYDVLNRWYMEKETGELDSGRVLPPEYVYFGGDGEHNWFRDDYDFNKANIWDWSWGSPYEEI